MVNRIRKFGDGTPVPHANGGSIGIGFKDDAIQVNVGAQGTDVVKQVQLVGAIGSELSTADGAVTLTAADAGKTVQLASLTGAAVTLPAADTVPAGTTFQFVVTVLPTSGSGHSIIPASGDAIGGEGLTFTDDADLLLAVATDALGDFVQLVSNGVADYIISAMRGTWSKV